MRFKIDLDVETPNQVAERLTQAADAYRESSHELTGLWQDPEAGAVWRDLAAILDRAAKSCTKAVAKRGLSNVTPAD